MGEMEQSNNKVEEEEEQKPLDCPHRHGNIEIRNLLGYFVVLEALFQARKLALAKKFEKKNEAHPQHLNSIRDTMQGSKESQKQLLDLVGIENGSFNDPKHLLFMVFFGFLDDLVRFLTFVGVQAWRDYKCLCCSGEPYDYKRTEAAVKIEKVEHKENMLYTVYSDHEDEEQMEVFFDYTRGNRRRRNIGLATMQTRQSYVKMNALRAMNRSGLEAMRTKIGTKKKNNNRKLPKKIGFHR